MGQMMAILDDRFCFLGQCFMWMLLIGGSAVSMMDQAESTSLCSLVYSGALELSCLICGQRRISAVEAKAVSHHFRSMQRQGFNFALNNGTHCAGV